MNDFCKKNSSHVFLSTRLIVSLSAVLVFLLDFRPTFFPYAPANRECFCLSRECCKTKKRTNYTIKNGFTKTKLIKIREKETS